MTRRSVLRAATLAVALAAFVGTASVHAAGKSDPKWSELKPAEQRVLAPLKDDWDRLDATRKRKWIGVAQKYPTMKPDEQARVQERMQAWAALSPEQRRAARENFRRQAQLPPEKRQTIAQKWEEYQQASKQGAPAPAPAVDSPSGEAQAVPTAAKE